MEVPITSNHEVTVPMCVARARRDRNSVALRGLKNSRGPIDSAALASADAQGSYEQQSCSSD